MSSSEEYEEKLIQMNELFEELIEDAYEFSKEIMLGVNFMPFAIGFFALITIGFTYYTFVMSPFNLIDKILNIAGIILLLYAIYILVLKYFILRKKYSTLFNLKERLDSLGEN